MKHPRVAALLEALVREVQFGREASTRKGIERLSRALKEDQSLFEAAPSFLKHDDWKVRYLVLRAMEESGHPSLKTLLPTMAEDDSKEVRATVDRLLGALAMERPAQVRELVGLLDNPSWWVRKKAVLGLGGLHCDEAVNALGGLVRREKDDEVRQLASSVLEQWRQAGV